MATEGWTVTLKGEGTIATDADRENLRSFSRNIVKGALAYGLGPSKATLSPAEAGSDGDVGVTPAEQTAEADKVEEEKAKKAGEAEAKAVADANTASAKAAKDK